MWPSRSLIALSVVLSCVGFDAVLAADPPKPGSAAWKRQFAEHERRMKEHRAKFANRGGPSRSPGGGLTDAKRAELRRGVEELRVQHEARMLRTQRHYESSLPPDLRAIYLDARNPRPFDAASAPKASECLLALQGKLLDETTTLRDVLPYLAAHYRERYVRHRTVPTLRDFDSPDAEQLADWRHILPYITEIDGVRNVDGVPGRVHVWAWVRPKEFSTGLYKFTLEGEGNFYKLYGYEADAIVLDGKRRRDD